MCVCSTYRLDAKSSRGMIYENEELRIRTININAEVERGIISLYFCRPEEIYNFFLQFFMCMHVGIGQSEIKNLKREREQLRREIWTLRDEYDKLENLLRIKGIDPDEFLNSNQDRNNDENDEDDVSECSECSCESCCDDECCEHEKSEPASNEEKNNENVINAVDQASSSKMPTETSSDVNISTKRGGKDRLNVHFHLYCLNNVTSF